MANNNSKPRLWSRSFILIAIASTGVSFATYFFLPTLPVYAQAMTGSGGWAGAMTGVYSLASLVSQPMAGYMADRVKRLALAFAGALVCLIACILYNFAAAITWLLVFRFMHGFGFGMHTTSANAAIIGMVPPERRTEGIGSFGLCMTIASAIAPAIALPLAANPETGLLPLSAAAGALLVVSLGSMLPVMQQDHAGEEQAGQGKDSGGFRRAAEPVAMLLLVACVQGAAVSFLALYALERGFGMIGFFFTCSAAGMILSRLFAGRICDKRGIRAVMLPSLFVYFLSVLGIAFVSGQTGMILLGFPFGLALGSITPAFNVIILSRFADNRHGAASALYFACLDAGIGGGSVTWGFLAGSIRYRGIFLASACICALLCVWYYLSGKNIKRNI